MIPLRSALFAAYFPAVTVLLLIPGTLARLVSPRTSLPMARLWARAVIGGLRVICGVRYTVSGLAHLPAGACLIASRHESAFDTFVWLRLLPRCTYVMKEELVRVPLLGAMMRAAGMIVVDRTAGASALRGLVRDATLATEAGRPIVIFPEGTRMPPGVEGRIQPGIAALAASLPVPVIPVATDSGRFWGRRAFRIMPGTIRVAVRPALPSGLGRADFVERLSVDIFGEPVDKSV